jgi:low affinity Fe/Cu permease
MNWEDSGMFSESGKTRLKGGGYVGLTVLFPDGTMGRETMRPASDFWYSVFIIIAWAICGPVFHYSDTWQLVINTGTTIITFLMVFLIQNTQNRDAAAVQLKLDELIRVSETARNKLLTLEDFTEAELD